MMKKLFLTTLFSAILAFLCISPSAAQISLPPIFEPDDDPFENLLNADFSDYQIRSGAFMGTGSGGAELLVYQKDKPMFLRLHYGMIGNPEKRITNARQMRFGGVSIGVERPIVSNNGSQVNVDSGVMESDRNGIRTYYRLGAGIDFAVVERYSLTGEQSSKLHPGIQTMGMVGVSTRVSQKLSLFMEIGGMLSWNQGLPQMRWWGQPYLSVGVSTASFW
ncbi:MAG: hypothetical protein RI575_12565 [Balneolaceae bacterium]|nr:hypothetical protein [Balneolaceae bacterium]MDR9410165.1 hypothetical protein [Balneolaceae bacterium]